ncbi:MAG: branched-chain amino acid ABC transporter permease [Prochloraceae cyanobacterium]|nr:branched-chain amino acid ABC transporter permease [Prochloraceae cyanobacterium]
MSITTLLFFFLNGLSEGLLLFLIALGLNLIFGVMGVLNFAHGSLYMLGAYLTYTIAVQGNLSFWLALIIAPVIVALVGGAIEILCLRPIYNRDVSSQLLLTFAFVLLINDLVRLLWGNLPLTILNPELFQQTTQILGDPYPTYNLFIILITPAIAIGLWLLLKRTRWGKLMRAAARDPVMTGALGINVSRLFTLVFILGTWLAGVAGVLAAPLRTINPAMGDNIIIESFIVVVIGGLGNLPGSLVGALTIGQVNSFGILIAQRAQVAFPFILMTIVLLLRPRGLFGKSRS